MATYEALIEWRLHDDDDVGAGKYSRAHRWTFDEGVTVAASSSKHVVPLPWSVEAAVDPEEALVAACSSCHMLTFLYIAVEAGFVPISYRDQAIGTMGKDDNGREQMIRVELRPTIDWQGSAPGAEKLSELHHQAHEQCYIANSVKFPIEVLS